MNFYLSFGSFWSWHWLETLAFNCSTFQAFIRSLATARTYNALAWLMRATNGVRLPMRSRAAPRWRRGRWKSKA